MSTVQIKTTRPTESQSDLSEHLHIQDTNSGGHMHDGYHFHKSGVVKNGIVYYRCAQKRRYKCRSSINIDQYGAIKSNAIHHNHPPREKKTSLFAGLIFLIIDSLQQFGLILDCCF